MSTSVSSQMYSMCGAIGRLSNYR